ncbi:uncharacterized protein LOC114351292 [Ostrinia furnacalis]|uniref:uncharacterized protein LOC114351292 n=1 Tax=Ostrinia furnacalis TaxID=93504 RepID=UPI00103D0C7D|nr:uncharacterized protein LOC114351292 [Ostrinia furnacalis]
MCLVSTNKMYIDTEQVIIEVHQRPVLWDKKHLLYKDRDAREAAWTEILAELTPDYQSLSPEDIKMADKKIQQRWRTARDSYKKDRIFEKNNPSGFSSKRKKYVYYDILTFLDGTENAGDESPCEELYEESHSLVETLLETPEVKPRSNKRRYKVLKRANKTKSGFGAHTCLKPNQLQLESEDLAFFQSLQPTLKRFTRYQKLMFRTKVLNIVMEMEKEAEPHQIFIPKSE